MGTMKAGFTFFLFLFFLSAQAQGPSSRMPTSPFYEWGSIGVEAEWLTDPVNLRTGFYLPTSGHARLFCKFGVLLARSDLMALRIYPFWLNYDISLRAYNTPITLEALILDKEHLKAGADVSLYKRRYAVNFFIYFRLFRDIK